MKRPAEESAERTPPERVARSGVGVKRREFLKKAAWAGAAGFSILPALSRAADKSTAPLATRVLGRTGVKVTILGLGTAPAGEDRRVDTPTAAKIFGEAIDRGVSYVDTAYIYGNAEEALGTIMGLRRDKIFLVTKVWTDSAERAEKILSESLKRLKTDHVDLIHIHNIGNKDIDKVLAKDGVLQYLLKQKEAGKTRFIGCSGHQGATNFLRMLETKQIDVMMPVLNYADRNIYQFESKVLPAARARNVGVVAMKVYVGIKGGFKNHRNGSVGCVTDAQRLPHAMAYALDLEGVSSAIIGSYTLEQAIQNVDFARQYKPLTTDQRTALLAHGKTLVPTLGPRYGQP